jgi:hypothetical protein
MNIGNIRRRTPDWDKNSEDGELNNVADAASAILGINKKKVKIKRGKIKDVAKGLAEIAFSMGETNDPEEYAEQMTEDILEAFKSIED